MSVGETEGYSDKESQRKQERGQIKREKRKNGRTDKEKKCSCGF